MSGAYEVNILRVQVTNLEEFSNEIMCATVVVLGAYKGNFAPFKIPVPVKDAAKFLPGTPIDLTVNPLRA